MKFYEKIILVLKWFPWTSRSQEKSFEIKFKKIFDYVAIPSSILKQIIEVYLKYLTNTINHSLKESTFPDELK